MTLGNSFYDPAIIEPQLEMKPCHAPLLGVSYL